MATLATSARLTSKSGQPDLIELPTESGQDQLALVPDWDMRLDALFHQGLERGSIAISSVGGEALGFQREALRHPAPAWRSKGNNRCSWLPNWVGATGQTLVENIGGSWKITPSN